LIGLFFDPKGKKQEAYVYQNKYIVKELSRKRSAHIKIK
jgi:hypothetical protein